MYFLLDSVFIALTSLQVFSSFYVFFVLKFALSNPVVLLVTRPWLRDHTSVSFNSFIVYLFKVVQHCIYFFKTFL